MGAPCRVGSAYYGIVSGMAQTEGSRRGSYKSGLRSTVQTWDGSLIASVRRRGDVDEFSLEVADGSDACGREIWRGTLADLVAALEG